jgi:hypothetical protein
MMGPFLHKAGHFGAQRVVHGSSLAGQELQGFNLHHNAKQQCTFEHLNPGENSHVAQLKFGVTRITNFFEA